MHTESKNIDKKKEAIGMIKSCAVAVVLGIIISKYIIANAFIPSGSMEPTIDTRSFVLVNRLAYIVSDIKRQDVIVFEHPDGDEKLLIKRVIGLPGDTVEAKENVLYINGEEIKEPYIVNNITWDFGPYTVPENSYFVLGDNRQNSYDARYWENRWVTPDMIIGKAMFEYIPHFNNL